MATTSNRLTDLYREALESVTATPETGSAFCKALDEITAIPFRISF